MTFRDGAGGSEQLGIEVGCDEPEGELNVRHTCEAAVQGGKRKFPRIVTRPVVKAECRDDIHAGSGVVKGGDGIHASAEEDDDLLLGLGGRDG
jgi:hypothetical protein